MNVGDKVLMVNDESFWRGQIGEVVYDDPDSEFVRVRFEGGVSGISEVSVLRPHVELAFGEHFVPIEDRDDSLSIPVKGFDAKRFLDGLRADHASQVITDEPMRHPGSQRFHDLLKELAELHDMKQRDYGSDTDPFANVRSSADWGIPGWVGALVRLNDKVKRLQAFARKGELANESAEDSMRDIAVYAIISLVLYEQESQQTA